MCTGAGLARKVDAKGLGSRGYLHGLAGKLDAGVLRRLVRARDLRGLLHGHERLRLGIVGGLGTTIAARGSESRSGRVSVSVNVSSAGTCDERGRVRTRASRLSRSNSSSCAFAAAGGHRRAKGGACERRSARGIHVHHGQHVPALGHALSHTRVQKRGAHTYVSWAPQQGR